MNSSQIFSFFLLICLYSLIFCNCDFNIIMKKKLQNTKLYYEKTNLYFIKFSLSVIIVKHFKSIIKKFNI